MARESGKEIDKRSEGGKGEKIKYEWSGSPSNPGYEPAAMQLLLMQCMLPRIPNCVYNTREDAAAILFFSIEI